MPEPLTLQQKVDCETACSLSVPLPAPGHREEERVACVWDAREEPLRTEASKQIRSFPFIEAERGFFSICSGPIPVLLKVNIYSMIKGTQWPVSGYCISRYNVCMCMCVCTENPEIV